MPVVKLSALLEFTIDTGSTEEEILTTIHTQLARAVRPGWKGFHFPNALPGEFVGQPKTVEVVLGHDVFVTPAPTRPRRRKR